MVQRDKLVRLVTRTLQQTGATYHAPLWFPKASSTNGTCSVGVVPSGLRACLRHFSSPAPEWSQARLPRSFNANSHAKVGIQQSWFRSFNSSLKGVPASLRLPSNYPPCVRGLGPALGMRHMSSLTTTARTSATKVLQRLTSSLGPRLSAAATLQLRSWWQRHSGTVYIAVAGLAAYLLWRALYGFTTMFVSVNSMFAEYGFLALAAAIVLLSFQYTRNYYGVDPAKVYRMSMRRLNLNPGVLEVLGAPLVGSNLRASVVTGGGLYLGKQMLPKLMSRRCQMIFPLQGSERRGLVSLEAKKKQGKYVFKLLAVDVTAPSGDPARPARPAEQQRVYVDGDAAIYERGGVLNELRDPFLRALSLQTTYEAEDEVDDELLFLEEERAARAKQEKAGKKAEEKAKEKAALAAGATAPDQGAEATAVPGSSAAAATGPEADKGATAGAATAATAPGGPPGQSGGPQDTPGKGGDKGRQGTGDDGQASKEGGGGWAGWWRGLWKGQANIKAAKAA